MTRLSGQLCVVGVLLVGTAAWAAGPPQPVGVSRTTVSYTTAAGPASFFGDRDYSGIGPTSATVLAGAPNIRTFNSVNAFGRRTLVDNTYPEVIGADESLLTHAFFKVDNSGDYFPGILHGTDVTVTVEGIQFDHRVTVDASTFMLHTLFLDPQVQQLGLGAYNHLHNHRTATDPFRNTHEFEQFGIFGHAGHGFPPDTIFGVVNPVVTGNGTDTLNISLTVPYEFFKNLEQVDQPVPPGLPGPHGFLEPFHFHLEYVVTPEPSTIMLLLGGVWLAARRRRDLP